MGGIPEHITERLKLIIAQTSGKIEDKEAELIPEHKIRGTGAVYCLLTDNRTFVKLERGTSIYIVQEKYDIYGKTLVYSVSGDIILIEPDEIQEIGFD